MKSPFLVSLTFHFVLLSLFTLTFFRPVENLKTDLVFLGAILSPMEEELVSDGPKSQAYSSLSNQPLFGTGQSDEQWGRVRIIKKPELISRIMPTEKNQFKPSLDKSSATHDAGDKKDQDIGVPLEPALRIPLKLDNND